jgi:hypothetical protein
MVNFPVFDRVTAMSFLKALCGGQDPKNGDTILFIAEGQGRNLGFVFSPAIQVNPDDGSSPGNPPALTWDNISGKPSTFPPSAHTHPPNVVLKFYEYGAVPARTVGFFNQWVGEADPAANAEPGDVWFSL